MITTGQEGSFDRIAAEEVNGEYHKLIILVTLDGATGQD